MTRHTAHLADDEMLALAYLGGDAPDDRETAALAHLADCDACSLRFSTTLSAVVDLRAVSEAEADRHFPESFLERQRRQILIKLEQLGQSARILRFPALPVSVAPAAGRWQTRRWVAAAAAAGLVAGLLLAEALQVLPGQLGWTASSQTAAVDENAGPVFEEDALLTEIDAALRWSRASELRALDELTPVAYEIR